jgi:hypothetical protein
MRAFEVGAASPPKMRQARKVHCRALMESNQANGNIVMLV